MIGIQQIALKPMESAYCIGDRFQRTQQSLVLTGKRLSRISLIPIRKRTSRVNLLRHRRSHE